MLDIHARIFAWAWATTAADARAIGCPRDRNDVVITWQTVKMTNVESSEFPIVGWICIDAADPEALADWWKELLGGSARVDEDGDVRLESGPVPLLFLRVDDPKTAKNRVHLDLRVTKYEEAVSRAVGLGATLADDIYRGDAWQVLRDPEGNEFCIIRPKAQS